MWKWRKHENGEITFDHIHCKHKAFFNYSVAWEETVILCFIVLGKAVVVCISTSESELNTICVFKGGWRPQRSVQ